MSDQPTPEPPTDPTPETPAAPAPEPASSPPPEPSAGPQSQAPVEEPVTPSPAPAAASAEAPSPPTTPKKTAHKAAAKPAPPPPAGGTTYTWGTGRRKSAVARVRIRPGSGKFLIRGREINHYFFDMRHQNDVIAPLKATETFGKYDVWVNVGGGGQTGQAGAIVLGVARALLKEDPSLEDTLRGGRYLTRDARKVERKKPGQPGARKRFQFSKR